LIIEMRAKFQNDVSLFVETYDDLLYETTHYRDALMQIRFTY